MLSSNTPSVLRHGRSRPVLAALLLAVGCSGTGSSCGSSCGGAFKTVDNNGQPIVYKGTKLDNVAQVRITKSAFDTLLSAGALNDLLKGLNGGAGFSIPCIGWDGSSTKPALPGFCACKTGSQCPNPPYTTSVATGFLDVTKVAALVGDENLNGKCDAADSTPMHVTFKTVTWALDPTNNLLRAKVVMHLKSGDLYFRTIEAHSSLSGNGQVPIEARIHINDEDPSLTTQDTELDLDLQFSTAPDGRLEIAPSQSSLDHLLDNLNPGIFFIDGCAGADPAPPASASYTDDGCDPVVAPSNTFNPIVSRGACNNNLGLAGGGLGNILDFGCSPDNSANGLICRLVLQARDFLLQYLKTNFKSQIVAVIQQQIDNVRCVRSTSQQVGCDATHTCPNDDDNRPTTCDSTRGICMAQGQTGIHCEPVALAIQGQLDLSTLSDKVGFPPDTKISLFAGLGGKTAPAAVSTSGLQLAGYAGTQPFPPERIAPCVNNITFPPLDTNIPALDFDLAANQPTPFDGKYDVGFSVASQMLNRGFYDGFNAGLFCITLSNKTAAAVSSGLFKTFLPSLGLLTGGPDVPMSILLRPTTAPVIRIGKGTYTVDPASGATTLVDPLIGIQLNQLNLDFYAIIDERSVRLFTLKADVNLPLGLRTFVGAQADMLQPVLGGLDTVLNNITASNNEMLAEDPGVVKDLIGAAIHLAQPLLAGALKPITLPRVLGLDFQVKGLGGAVPVSSNVAVDGYHHLAIWAAIAHCGAPPLSACARYQVGTEARIADSQIPDDLEELRGPNRIIPAAIIEARSITARPVASEFSYKIDGGLWSPWVQGPRFTIRDLSFLFQGHHTIEVTSREAGDDRTQNLEPAVLDFLVSVEPPTVDLVALSDGSVITKARSAASKSWQMKYAYKLEGDAALGEKGEARTFTAAELGGRGIAVQVTDEAGRTAKAALGMALTEDARAAQLAGSGCGTSPQSTTLWSLFPLLGVALVLATRRRRAQ